MVWVRVRQYFSCTMMVCGDKTGAHFVDEAHCSPINLYPCFHAWVETRRIRLKIQVAKIRFLFRVTGHILQDEARCSKFCESLGIEPLLLQIQRNMQWAPLDSLQGYPWSTPWTPWSRPRTCLERLYLTSGLS